MTLRGAEGGDPRLNVIMTLNFPKIVWKCPLKYWRRRPGKLN
jgi:hypothetical protein